MSTRPMPTFYIPHGGGPCFFMDWTMGPRDTWDRMATWLRGIRTSLPRAPRAILVVSGHWEAEVPTVLGSAAPPLLYDYYGFPEHTYRLTWPAPGEPKLAERVRELLAEAGFESVSDTRRGFDHGVFVPLKVAFPEADVPTVQLSLVKGLDPGAHLAIGRALQKLRDDDVLIVGSGMSYHNMRGFMTGPAREHSAGFDGWLAEVVAREPASRDDALAHWTRAPFARESHPREEHLLPLMVAAGAAGKDRGSRVFQDDVMGVTVSAIRFG